MKQVAKCIYETLESLRQCRPFFHWEADFRNEFAQSLREKFSRVSEEVPFSKGSRVKYIDIVVDGKIAIELKYPVKLSVVWRGEKYNRNNMDSRKNPASVGRDIIRLQELANDSSCKIQRGFVIVLTNSNLLQKEPYDWREWCKLSEKKIDHFYYAVIPVVRSGD